MLDLEGTALSGEEIAQLGRPSVGGVILFSRNYASPQQLKDLAGHIRDVAPEVLIAVDQEGGRVQRFREGFIELPPLRRLGEAYEREPEAGISLAYACGWCMAAQIRHHHLDFSFAPVLDLYNPDSRVIADRAFSSNPETVSALARAYVEGMHDAGMPATGKHYPGHGSVVADSHTELPRDERAWPVIEQNDFSVFKACQPFLDGIMPAHVIYPAVDPACAGFSHYWISRKLRDDLGFDGVVFSDDLSMQAAVESAGSVSQRAQLALSAGCDMILVCNDPVAARQCADWIEEEDIGPNSRLGTMRGREGDVQADLYQQDKWLELTGRIAASVFN